MKTANLLSLSTFIVLAGLMTSVGCSTPAVGDLDESNSADSTGDDDDDDSTTSKKTTKSKTTNDDEDDTMANTADDEDTTTTTGGDQCDSCLSANASAKKYAQCASSCNDEQCDDDCFENSGCASDQSCESTLDQCASACGQEGDDDDLGDDDDDLGGDDPCFQCLGNSAAAQYIECSDQCTNAKCDDKCFDQACGSNPDACESKLDSCEQECFGG